MRIEIVGAGVGGLAVGTLLARAGHRVALTERFAEPRPVGSGLMLQPPGLAALRRMGLSAPILALGHRVDALHGTTQSGRTVFDIRYDALSPAFYGVAVHRAALHGVLWRAFNDSGATVRLGREVSDPGDPLFAGADLLIDASGAASALRPSVTRRQPSLFPYGAVWATVPHLGPVDRTLAQRYVAARSMMGYLPIGRPSADGPESAALFWSLGPDRYDAWRSGFADWKSEAEALWPEMAPVLRVLSGPETFSHAVYRHFTADRLWNDRLVLIGDAAHSTSPQLGQGANHALLDAVALADSLQNHRSVPDALAHYVRTRRAHVRFYQMASWAMTPMFQSDSRIMPWLRDLTFNPMTRLPYFRHEIVRTLAGLKTGLFVWRTPESIAGG